MGFKCGKCNAVHLFYINYVQNYTFSALESNISHEKRINKGS